MTTTTQGKQAVGVYLGQAERDEAARLARSLNMTRSTVLRMAVEAGLPLVPARMRAALDAEEQDA